MHHLIPQFHASHPHVSPLWEAYVIYGGVICRWKIGEKNWLNHRTEVCTCLKSHILKQFRPVNDLARQGDDNIEKGLAVIYSNYCDGFRV